MGEIPDEEPELDISEEKEIQPGDLAVNVYGREIVIPDSGEGDSTSGDESEPSLADAANSQTHNHSEAEYSAHALSTLSRIWFDNGRHQMLGNKNVIMSEWKVGESQIRKMFDRYTGGFRECQNQEGRRNKR